MGALPCPFLKVRKNGSDSVHLSVKISIQNVVLWVSRKPPKFYPAMPFFLKFLTRCLSKCPNSPKIALVARKLCLPSVARFKLLYWIPKRNSLLDKWLSFNKCSFPIDFAINMSAWCSERTTQPETIPFSLVVTVYWYIYIFLYAKNITFICVSPLLLLLFFIIFIVLLPFSMNFEFKFDLNFNSISFFHVNSKISLGFFLIKEKSLGLSELVSKIQEIWPCIE